MGPSNPIQSNLYYQSNWTIEKASTTIRARIAFNENCYSLPPCQLIIITINISCALVSVDLICVFAESTKSAGKAAFGKCESLHSFAFINSHDQESIEWSRRRRPPPQRRCLHEWKHRQRSKQPGIEYLQFSNHFYVCSVRRAEPKTLNKKSTTCIFNCTAIAEVIMVLASPSAGIHEAAAAVTSTVAWSSSCWRTDWLTTCKCNVVVVLASAV